MNALSTISKFVFDHSPRQLVHYARRRLLKQERLRSFDTERPCVFVLSTGRTGTQTLAALLGLAKNVFAYHEPIPKLYGLSKLSYQHSNDRLGCEILQEAFLTARRELLDYSLDCGRGYVETSPQTTFLAPIILDAIPEARFIHLVRDPRDVVRSGMRRGWYDGSPFDKNRIVPRPDSEVSRQWKVYNAFQKNLWLWTETNRWISKFYSGLPADRTRLVHSEDVFSSDEETMSRLFAFAGAPVPSSWKMTRVLNKKLNAQKTGQFPKPSAWSEEMYSDLLAIAGETARDLGYEL